MGVVGQGDEVPFTTTSIRVDIDGLSDFRTFLSSEVDANLRPGSDDVIYDHVMGVRFGRCNPGFNIGQATKSYHSALDNSTNNLFEYVKTAGTLTQLIRLVVEKYRTSDLTAAGSSDKINAVFADALKVVNTPNSETDRETYRAVGTPDPDSSEHLANRLELSASGLPDQHRGR